MRLGRLLDQHPGGTRVWRRARTWARSTCVFEEADQGVHRVAVATISDVVAHSVPIAERVGVVVVHTPGPAIGDGPAMPVRHAGIAGKAAVLPCGRSGRRRHPNAEARQSERDCEYPMLLHESSLSDGPSRPSLEGVSIGTSVPGSAPWHCRTDRSIEPAERSRSSH